MSNPNAVFVRVVLQVPLAQAAPFYDSVLGSFLGRMRELKISEKGDGAEDGLDAAGLEGEPTVRLLIRHLQGQTEQFMAQVKASITGKVEIVGVLDSWFWLHVYSLGLFELAAAAEKAGGRGQVSLMGELHGEVVIQLLDLEDGGMRFRKPDPQNTPEEVWRARLGEFEALKDAYLEWLRCREA